MRLPFFRRGGGGAVDTSNLATKDELADAISALVGLAPDELDTLQEIATQVIENEDSVGALALQIAGKQDLNARLTALANSAIGGRSIVRVPAAGGNPEYVQISEMINTLLQAADAAAARQALGVIHRDLIICGLANDQAIVSGARIGTLIPLINQGAGAFSLITGTVPDQDIVIGRAGTYTAQNSIFTSTQTIASVRIRVFQPDGTTELMNWASASTCIFTTPSDNCIVRYEGIATVTAIGMRQSGFTIGPYWSRGHSSFHIERIV